MDGFCKHPSVRASSLCYNMIMSDKSFDIVIIGAGASGLMLAANLDLGCRSGVILEGSSSIGSKLLMSGGGRCNITHGGSIKDFVSAYGESGPLLRKCLYKHNNTELAACLENLGVETAGEDGRVFPASMKAKDVLDAFIGEVASNMWQIETDAKVCGIQKGADGCWEIELADRGMISTRNVVIASGGITYPETGSDGSMFKILKALGLAIKDPRPALAPIYVVDYPYKELSGVSVPDVSVAIYDGAQKITSPRMRGDLLFTHEGFSGPAVLNVSGYAKEGDILSIGYNKELKELPRSLQKVLENRARGESGDVRTKTLTSLLEHDDFVISKVSDRGMVTRGGVMLDELDMHTLECKNFDNLYVIGEALDADGITGGYNLQMCWSTACTCADDLKDKL